MFSKKITLFIAANAMALFLGAFSVSAQTQQPPPCDTTTDTDGDGVADFALDPAAATGASACIVLDECPNSNLAPTALLFDTCDTGILNTVNANGCTTADVFDEMFDDCLDAKNHGKFVSCVSHQTNILKRTKIITGKQKGKIQSCVAHIK
jgi:hypothetical protein